jgi:hypothetical protein
MLLAKEPWEIYKRGLPRKQNWNTFINEKITIHRTGKIINYSKNIIWYVVRTVTSKA